MRETAISHACTEHTIRRRSRRIFLCLPLRETPRHALLCRGSSICRRQIFAEGSRLRETAISLCLYKIHTQHVDEVGEIFYACPSGKRRGMSFYAAVRQFAAGKFLRRAPACGKPQFPYAYTKYTHNTSTKSAYFFMPAPQGNSAACPFMPRFVNLPQANFQQFTRLPALYRPYHNASNFRIPSVCSYCNNNGLPFLNNHHRSKYHSIARLSPYKTQLSV